MENQAILILLILLASFAGYAVRRHRVTPDSRFRQTSAKGKWRGVGERVFWLCVSFHHVIFYDETNNNKEYQRTRSVIPSAAHVQIHAAAILKRSDVGARASTSALVFRQLRAAGKQMQCVRCAQHNIVWLWLDGTTVVTIHIHHGAHATCVDKQPPESESMSARKKVCCRLPSHEDSLKHTRLRGDWHRTVFK
jgi:hypothetical protein